MRLPSFLPAVIFHTTTITLATALSNPNPILTSSFTWNPTCGPTVACGPSAAGHHGIGFAASNNLTYAGCNNLGKKAVECKASKIVSGVGNGCGQCWHITPQSDPFPSNGRSVGTSVVVKINDQCTDAGYCDQTEAQPVNTGYGKEVHIDLCAGSGVTEQFFGAVGPGVLTGLAQLLPDCSALDDGPYGSGLGSLDGSSSASGSSSSVSAVDSSSSSSIKLSSGSSGHSSSKSESESSKSESESSKSESESSKSESESSKSESKSSSSFNTDTSSKSRVESLDSASESSGSGNWSLSGVWMGKQKLSSGHDGQKAGPQVAGGATNAGSNGESNDGGEVSSSSSVSLSPAPTPTTLVAVVSSSTAPAPADSSVTVDTDEGEDCDSEEFDEL